MECRCNDTTEFQGAEAEEYAAAHLVADDAGRDVYSCPDTGKRWVLDWPEPSQARLRAETPT